MKNCLNRERNGTHCGQCEEYDKSMPQCKKTTINRSGIPWGKTEIQKAGKP